MQIKKTLLFAGAASAATSICDKYTTALLKNNTAANQYTLLTLLVNTAVIGNYTGPGTKNPTLPGSMVNVPGILATGQSVNLLQYFDGSLLSTNNNGKPASVNFLDGGGATPIIADPTSSGTKGSNQYNLLTHLYSYFGILLGCSSYAMTGFPAYAGTVSQYSVHQYMDLSEAEFNYFVSQVGAAALSFGASMADVTTVATALNSTFGMRCSKASSVVPNSGGSVLNAICVDSTCPLASGGDCSAYSPESMPAPASGSSMAMSMSAPVYSMSASAPVYSMSAAATSAPAVVSQISDGQPQATAPGPAYSGAAAQATVLPAAVLGLAGLAAMAL